MGAVTELVIDGHVARDEERVGRVFRRPLLGAPRLLVTTHHCRFVTSLRAPIRGSDGVCPSADGCP